jgi:hypothetical protein
MPESISALFNTASHIDGFVKNPKKANFQISHLINSIGNEIFVGFRPKLKKYLKSTPNVAM